MLFQEKENVINKCVLYFSIRMERLTIESNLFEDSEDFSMPLLTANPRSISARPTCVLSPLDRKSVSKFSTTVFVMAWVICDYLKC